SIFGSIKSFMSPILSRVKKHFLRNATKNVLGLVKDVGSDIVSGKNVKNSVIQRGLKRSLSTLKGTISGAFGNTRRRRGGKQRGSGKRRVSSKPKKRHPPKKRHSRKRPIRTNHSSKAKRRRCSNF
ncbi:MAG: hypothetical protein AAGK05_12260, partial [Pseudomonadota bacterium]